MPIALTYISVRMCYVVFICEDSRVNFYIYITQNVAELNTVYYITETNVLKYV